SLISSEVIRNPDITKNTSTPRPARSPVPFRYASCDTQKPLVPHRWPYKTSSIETARRPSSEGILLALSSDMTTFPPGTANSRSRSTAPFAILITAAACGGEKRDTVPAPGVHSVVELRHDLFPFPSPSRTEPAFALHGQTKGSDSRWTKRRRNGMPAGADARLRGSPVHARRILRLFASGLDESPHAARAVSGAAELDGRPVPSRGLPTGHPDHRSFVARAEDARSFARVARPHGDSGRGRNRSCFEQAAHAGAGRRTRNTDTCKLADDFAE